MQRRLRQAMPGWRWQQGLLQPLPAQLQPETRGGRQLADELVDVADAADAAERLYPVEMAEYIAQVRRLLAGLGPELTEQLRTTQAAKLAERGPFTNLILTHW